MAGESNALRDAVTAKVVRLAQPHNGRPVTADQTQVNVMREAATEWVFGSAVALAPPEPDAYPEGWLFIAHRSGDSWTVAFDGEVYFPKLTADAPEEVVPAPEKAIFASHGPGAGAKVPSAGDVSGAASATDAAAKPLANGDYRTGMSMPYALGQSWRLTGGPHESALQALDLAGGDGRVLAARDGSFFVMCGSGRGWVRVVHDRGYSTDYYHLFNNRTGGGTVTEGTFLGNIGTDVSCGGAANGAHVHFSLRQNGVFVGIAGHNFGKWQPYNGSVPYDGYALHGSALAGINGSMFNHGALGFTEGIIDTNGGGVLNRRAGPGTNFAVVGTVPDGATVSIACSANGTSHTGRFGYTTTMWNKLTDNSWISDAFTWTGTGNPVNGWC